MFIFDHLRRDANELFLYLSFVHEPYFIDIDNLPAKRNTFLCFYEPDIRFHFIQALSISWHTVLWNQFKLLLKSADSS